MDEKIRINDKDNFSVIWRVFPSFRRSLERSSLVVTEETSKKYVLLHFFKLLIILLKKISRVPFKNQISTQSFQKE